MYFYPLWKMLRPSNSLCLCKRMHGWILPASTEESLLLSHRLKLGSQKEWNGIIPSREYSIWCRVDQREISLRSCRMEEELLCSAYRAPGKMHTNMEFDLRLRLECLQYDSQMTKHWLFKLGLLIGQCIFQVFDSIIVWVANYIIGMLWQSLCTS